MSLDFLPEEILLKIGELLSSDLDFVSFTLTNRRTFHIFSTANYQWRQRLDEDDQLVSDALEGGQPASCPAKEIFFRRSNTEYNLRTNNFKVADVCNLSPEFNDLFKLMMRHCLCKDFFIRLYETHTNVWHLYWFDASGETVIQRGSLTRPESDYPYFVEGVFPASNKVVIVQCRSQNCHNKYALLSSQPDENVFEFLVAIDLARSEELRVLWTTPSRKLDGYSFGYVDRWAKMVVVANSKIYVKEEDLDGLSRIVVLSAETGETLSTLTLSLGGPLFELQGPEGRGVMEPVKWIAVRTRDKNYNSILLKEQILILNLENNEAQPIYLDIYDDKLDQIDYEIILYRNFLYIGEMRAEEILTEVEYYSTDVEEYCFQKVFQIPSGVLLHHNDIPREEYRHVRIDPGDGVLHLVIPNYEEPKEETIVSFNSRIHAPTYNKGDNIFYNDGPIVFSSLITLSNGNPLQFAVEPFGNKRQPRTKKSRQKIFYTILDDHFHEIYFVTRSKAILVVMRKNEKGQSLVLIDFAI